MEGQITRQCKTKHLEKCNVKPIKWLRFYELRSDQAKKHPKNSQKYSIARLHLIAAFVL